MFLWLLCQWLSVCTDNDTQEKHDSSHDPEETEGSANKQPEPDKPEELNKDPKPDEKSKYLCVTTMLQWSQYWLL